MPKLAEQRKLKLFGKGCLMTVGYNYSDKKASNLPNFMEGSSSQILFIGGNLLEEAQKTTKSMQQPAYCITKWNRQE